MSQAWFEGALRGIFVGLLAAVLGAVAGDIALYAGADPVAATGIALGIWLVLFAWLRP